MKMLLWSTLFTITCLFSLFLGVFLYHYYEAALFWFLVKLGVLFGASWVLICALNPSHSNVRCPRCQQQSLTPLVLGTPTGVRCVLCKYEDSAHSTHFLVPLKEIPQSKKKKRWKYLQKGR